MNITLSAPRINVSDASNIGGVAIPGSVLEGFFSPARIYSGDYSVHAGSVFAASGTGITITPAGAYPVVTGTGALLNKGISLGGGTIASLEFLTVFARRRPGSTGTISAQTVTIRVDDASGTILGTIDVGAAAAGAEPVSDLFHKEWRVNPLGVNAIHLVHTADADVEFVFDMGGTS